MPEFFYIHVIDLLDYYINTQIEVKLCLEITEIKVVLNSLLGREVLHTTTLRTR